MSSPPATTIQKSSPAPKLSLKSPYKNTPTSRSKNDRGKKATGDTNSQGRDKASSSSGTSFGNKQWTRARIDERRRKQQESLSIAVAIGNTANQRMRKVAGCTFDDDDDCSCQLHRKVSMKSYDSEENHTSNTTNTEQTEKEAMSMRRSRSIPVDGGEASEQGPHTVELGPKRSNEGGGDELNGKKEIRSKASNLFCRPSEFVFPAALVSEESDSDRRQLTRSMHSSECLVEVENEIMQPNLSQQSKTEKQYLDGVQDDSSDESQPVVQITRRGMEVRGFVAPTTKQRQLMRMVSGLGMEDPVFGRIADQVTPKHASNIYDDMDLHDVPEDMRDLLTLVSDRTGGVDLDDDIFDSPLSSRENESDQRTNVVSSLRAVSNLHNSCSSLAPLGLDPSAMMLPGIFSPRRSPTKKSSSRNVPHPPPQDDSAKSTTSAKKSHYEAPPPPNYTPPTGSFVRKKTSRKPSTVYTANVKKRDESLPARRDAIFQKSVSTVEYTSNGVNVTPSPAQNEFRIPRPRRNKRSSTGNGSDSHQLSISSNSCDRGISTSSVYVPPEMATMGPRTTPLRHNEDRRALPSMDALFPEIAGSIATPKMPTTIVSLRGGDQEMSSTGHPKTCTSYGLPPCFSPSKLKTQSTRLSSNILPPPAAYPSVRKSAAAYNVKAKRRDTASTTNMSPSSSLGTDGKWSYPENPTRFSS
jgi:hypothetical protein